MFWGEERGALQRGTTRFKQWEGEDQQETRKEGRGQRTHSPREGESCAGGEDSGGRRTCNARTSPRRARAEEEKRRRRQQSPLLSSSPQSQRESGGEEEPGGSGKGSSVRVLRRRRGLWGEGDVRRTHVSAPSTRGGGEEAATTAVSPPLLLPTVAEGERRRGGAGRQRQRLCRGGSGKGSAGKTDARAYARHHARHTRGGEKSNGRRERERATGAEREREQRAQRERERESNGRRERERATEARAATGRGRGLRGKECHSPPSPLLSVQGRGQRGEWARVLRQRRHEGCGRGDRFFVFSPCVTGTARTWVVGWMEWWMNHGKESPRRRRHLRGIRWNSSPAGGRPEGQRSSPSSTTGRGEVGCEPGSMSRGLGGQTRSTSRTLPYG